MTTSSSRKGPIPKCVLCKIKLEQKDQYLFKCPNPKCKKEYTLYYEIMSYDDSVGTAYDEESDSIELEGLAGATGSRLEIIEDEIEQLLLNPSSLDEEKEKGSIPIPKYM